jgi:hypothetical protein
MTTELSSILTLSVMCERLSLFHRIQLGIEIRNSQCHRTFRRLDSSVCSCSRPVIFRHLEISGCWWRSRTYCWCYLYGRGWLPRISGGAGSLPFHATSNICTSAAEMRWRDVEGSMRCTGPHMCRREDKQSCHQLP